MGDGPAPARHCGNFARTGAAMQSGILARPIGVEFMVGVLHGRDLEPAPAGTGITLVTSVVVAGAGPACEADDAHGYIIWMFGPPAACPAPGCGRGSSHRARLQGKPLPQAGRGAPRSAENRSAPARPAGTRAHTSAPPARWRAPSRRGVAR